MRRPYSELVAEAERAVSGVSDTELKRAAFEKILDDLLSESGEASVKPLSTKLQSTRAADKGSVAKRKSQRGGPKAYVIEMIEDDFFKKVKTIGEVKTE